MGIFYQGRAEILIRESPLICPGQGEIKHERKAAKMQRRAEKLYSSCIAQRWPVKATFDGSFHKFFLDFAP